ncbi:MAG: DUF2357 domain-containing protein [Mycoplasmatota bacterium]|nr:DUF2357 domain-containing protein [Mycoplasmatota bacterium]
MEEEIIQENTNNEDFELVRDDLFMNNLNSTLAVKREYELNEFDYEWLEKIEETLPYLDNILRNPKRFIINEEEIVKVELARKVTVESVIHLTQHTNLIQDIDEKKGDVKPSKILNINKEESLDTYENRFIYTLVNNLRTFFEQRVEATGENSSYMDKKDLAYVANTKVGSEDVRVSLRICSLDKNIKENKNNENGLSYVERLKKVQVQLDGFSGTELMQTLNKLHVSPVRSPIRKTNVILKNPNFKKAEELWNYIQSFRSKDRKEKDKQDYYDKGTLKEQYDQAFLLEYIANRTIGITNGNGQNGVSDKKLVSETLQRVIENILDADMSISEDGLKEIFDKQISTVKTKNTEKARNVVNIFNDRFEREEKRRNEIFLLLNGDE